MTIMCNKRAERKLILPDAKCLTTSWFNLVTCTTQKQGKKCFQFSATTFRGWTCLCPGCTTPCQVRHISHTFQQRKSEHQRDKSKEEHELYQADLLRVKTDTYRNTGGHQTRLHKRSIQVASLHTRSASLKMPKGTCKKLFQLSDIRTWQQNGNSLTTSLCTTRLVRRRKLHVSEWPGSSFFFTAHTWIQWCVTHESRNICVSVVRKEGKEKKIRKEQEKTDTHKPAPWTTTNALRKSKCRSRAASDKICMFTSSALLFPRLQSIFTKGERISIASRNCKAVIAKMDSLIVSSSVFWVIAAPPIKKPLKHKIQQTKNQTYWKHSLKY